MFRSLLIFLIALWSLPAAAAGTENWRFDGVDRVVAIADVHGAYDAMVETLGNVGILDANLAWSGGDSHLVIVGDLLDRGRKSRNVLDLLMRLENEAAAAGGHVEVLIGNHEMMNMVGDLRYVSKFEFAAFSDDETRGQRNRWFKAWSRRNGARTLSRQHFDDQFPRGYFALREAYGPTGLYGKWLLRKNVIAVINKTAFVHGGLPPLVAELGLEGINRGFKQDLIDYLNAAAVLTEAEVLLPTDSFYDHEEIVSNYLPPLEAPAEVAEAVATIKRLGNARVLDSEGPLWYRGNVACSEIVEAHRLKMSLRAIGAERVVVGHTPTPTRTVLQRFDGRVVEVDTGMLNFYYKGTGNALVLEGGELRVFNQSGADSYAPRPHPRRVGSRSGNLTTEKLKVLLETGAVVKRKKDRNTGRTIVEVSDDTHAVSAIFRKRGGKGFYPDVAAYRLDRLLGLDMVPVATVRNVNNVEGSLQFLPAKSSNEKERSSSGHGGEAACALPLQWEAMHVFDALIYNEGRSMDRMLYDTYRWNLILVEHERAFKSSRGKPAHLRAVPMRLSEGWRDALTELSDEVLAEHFSGVLDQRRIKALGARRDQLLAE